MTPRRRTRGAQPGNTNAVTHGLYTRAAFSVPPELSDDLRADIIDAAARTPPTDLRPELLALRVHLLTLLEQPSGITTAELVTLTRAIRSVATFVDTRIRSDPLIPPDTPERATLPA